VALVWTRELWERLRQRAPLAMAAMTAGVPKVKESQLDQLLISGMVPKLQRGGRVTKVLEQEKDGTRATRKATKSLTTKATKRATTDMTKVTAKVLTKAKESLEKEMRRERMERAKVKN